MRNDLVERKIKSRRKSSKIFLEFQKKLGLDLNVVTCDKQDIISALQVAFKGEIILTQYCIKNKWIDAYFSECKLGIEFDEIKHGGRNSNYERSRQLTIEIHGITIIRTNPNAAGFDMNRLINQIYKHIAESNKEKSEKEKLEKEKEVEIKKLKNKLKQLKVQIKESKMKNKKLNN